MEPYLNRSASSAHFCSGSSRKSLYQATHPPTTPSSSSTNSVLRILRLILELIIAALLKCFQILHERVFVLGAEIGAVFLAFMAGVAVAGQAGVEFEILVAFFLRHVGNETDPLAVKHIVAAIEFRAPLRGRLQPFP